MIRSIITPLVITLLALGTASCGRNVRTAQDITPGNYPKTKLDWRYGAGDIRIQTTKLSQELMDRWFAKTGFDCSCCKPRLVLTEIDNRTDCYISTDMIRDIFEGVAINDGRFSIVVGDAKDEKELDYIMHKISKNPKYSEEGKPGFANAKAPEFLVKVRITKSVTADRFYDYEDYRMTVTLYDIETQEAIDSAWDVLRKKVKG